MQFQVKQSTFCVKKTNKKKYCVFVAKLLFYKRRLHEAHFYYFHRVDTRWILLVLEKPGINAIGQMRCQSKKIY